MAIQGLIGILAAVLLAGCGSPPPVFSPHTRSQSNLQSIMEDDPLLGADPAGTLAALQALGVDRVRVDLRWSVVAPAPDSANAPAGFDPTDPAAYPSRAWAPWDTIDREAHARGIGLDLSLVGPAPNWATGPGQPNGAPPGIWRPEARRFGEWVRALGKRYSGSYTPPGSGTPLPRIDFWSVWNEPNYGIDLAPQAIDHSRIEASPAIYRRMLDAAWSALLATGHGQDTVLIGETAPRGITTGDNPGNFSGMVPLRFVRALYCVDGALQPLRGAAATVRDCPPTAAGSARFSADHPALFRAAGFADHPYPQGSLPPDMVIPGEPDYADLASISNLERTLDRVHDAYGQGQEMPIFSTEFGYQTNPPEVGLLSPAIAAGYLNWSEYISWRDPRIHSYDQYLLRDVQAASATGGFPTGLQFKTGAPKATLDAFRLPLYLPVTTAGRRASLEVWGCVRPARYARQQTATAQHVLIQFAGGATGGFGTIRDVTVTDPHGYFDVAVAFPRSGRVRLAWRYPSGQLVFSRVVGVTVG
jgi:hypothetical protein